MKRWLLYAVVVVLSSAGVYYGKGARDDGAAIVATDGVAVIEQAYRQQQSEVWVEVAGRVNKLLADDNKGSRHQRFIVQIESGRTLLVAHNIDLAERIPLNENDLLHLRGRYEWNQKGGVLHWTHHDPSGRLAGGWVEHDGKRYQ